MKPCDMTILLLVQGRTPPPSVREIGNVVNKSDGFVHHRIDRLVELELLSREPGKARTLALTPGGDQIIAGWVLGKEIDGTVVAPWPLE